jgi:hypothetical protein
MEPSRGQLMFRRRLPAGRPWGSKQQNQKKRIKKKDKTKQLFIFVPEKLRYCDKFYLCRQHGSIIL